MPGQIAIPLRLTQRLLKKTSIIICCISIGWLLVYITSRKNQESTNNANSYKMRQSSDNSPDFNHEFEDIKIFGKSSVGLELESNKIQHVQIPIETEKEEELVHPVGLELENTKIQHVQIPIETEKEEELVHPNVIKPVVAIEPNKNSKIVKSSSIKLCQNVHVFYYPWYGNPTFDGRYLHWNHKPIPHWDPNVAKLYQHFQAHVPPNDIGSDFYPELGVYSSRDPNTITEHMKQIVFAGIKVIVVSYYPPKLADDNGKPWEKIYPILLDKALKYDLKVTFHIEPYKNRNEISVRDDIKHIVDKYGYHKAFYKYKIKDGAFVPFIYVYDTYHTKPEQWARLLKIYGDITIRGTKYDCMVIALAVEQEHKNYVTTGGFNGLYTYFAVNDFTYGSNWLNWGELEEFARETNTLFIPSVGPGYIDTSIRPWNSQNTRNRLKGEYYKNAWKTALAVDPRIVSITSFNEWHEGTQIEKAIPKIHASREYKDYRPFTPDYYLKLTKDFTHTFSKCNAN